MSEKNPAVTHELPRTDTVDVGSVVTLDFGDGVIETCRVVSAKDSIPRDAVTSTSPLGVKMMGKMKDDEVTFNTPKGGEVKVIILSVSNPEI